MRQKKTSLLEQLEQVSSELLSQPHVVDKLVHLFTGEWQQDTIQQEKLVTHLTECLHCRTLLITLLIAEQKYEKSNGSADTFIDNLCTRFVDIHHAIMSQDAIVSQAYEQMGAYAEAIIAKGEKETIKQFPKLAAHISTCPDCKTTLEETLTFLKGAEEMY